MAMPKLISANRLNDGIVVYLGRGGAWSNTIDEAVLLSEEAEVAATLRRAEADVQGNVVVDPIVVDVEDIPGGRRPRTLRDIIRARGPTVDFLAKVHDEQAAARG